MCYSDQLLVLLLGGPLKLTKICNSIQFLSALSVQHIMLGFLMEDHIIITTCLQARTQEGVWGGSNEPRFWSPSIV